MCSRMFRSLLAATLAVSVMSRVLAVLTPVWTFAIAVLTAVKLLSTSVFNVVSAVFTVTKLVSTSVFNAVIAFSMLVNELVMFVTAFWTIVVRLSTLTWLARVLISVTDARDETFASRFVVISACW